MQTMQEKQSQGKGKGLRLLALSAMCSALLLTACATTQGELSKEQNMATSDLAQVSTASTLPVVSSGQDLPFGVIGDDVSARFTGQVFFKALIDNEPQYQFHQTNLITFAPGSRSAWHNHGPMYLLGIGGVGYYQEEGQPAVMIKPGDVVFCTPEVRHWHGAAPDSWFSQVVVYDSHYQPANPWPKPVNVTDEQYQAATAASAAAASAAAAAAASSAAAATSAQ